jgi:2-hydroxychromene-2-carboxylate isomerase
MGEVIQFARRRPAPKEGTEAVTFFFDLACPYTYLAAERLDRRFGGARWRPASGQRLAGGPFAGCSPEATPRAIADVEQRARELHMPLVWPERFPAAVPFAMRAASYAAACGRGPEFAIAVGRLAFCGGFDVEDPHILGEAAAAAGLDVEETLDAAEDERRDRELEAAARALWANGGRMLPAVAHRGGLFSGEQGVTAAMFALPPALGASRL